MEQLCAVCSRIDFQHLLSTDLHLPLEGYPVVPIIDLNGLEKRDCHFCQLMATVRPYIFSANKKDEVDPPSHGWALRLYPGTILEEPWYRKKGGERRLDRTLSESGVFAIILDTKHGADYREDDPNWIVKAGFIYHSQDTSSTSEAGNVLRNLNRATADLELAKAWLAECVERHDGTCESRVSEAPPYLRLFDCQSLDCVENEDGGPASAYIALSYVWGRQNPKREESQPAMKDVLVDLPLVIRDAISVTKSIGYRYLWADQICLDPPGTKRRKVQIASMHSIYGNADLTLIAAAGEDMDFGLPGVSQRSRQGQLAADVGPFTFVAHPRAPKFDIKQSSWMTRAWTYEEAILSRRRLYFTPQQLYFECASMTCPESLRLNVQKRTDNNPIGVLGAPKAYQIFDKILFDPEWLIIHRIHDYSGRRLTHERDALDASLGFLERFRLFRKPISHLWGVPILNPINNSERKQGYNDHRIKIFVGFVNGLCWKLERPGRRRALSFPSWSWVGWEGKVSKKDLNWVDFYLDQVIESRVAMCDGTLLSLEKYIDLIFSKDQKADIVEPSCSITMRVLVLQVRLTYNSERQKWTVQRYASSQENFKEWSPTPLHLDKEFSNGTIDTLQIQSRPWKAMVVGKSRELLGKKRRPKESTIIIILDKVQDHWERFGYAKIVHKVPEENLEPTVLETMQLR